MGKGKGGFIRWVFRIQRGLIIAEFLGIPKYRLQKILLKINKKLKLKLILISNQKLCQTTTLWCK
jgi:ribosomal protein L16/L10AE